ncbi:MAG: hypothetical protein IPL31_04575 [Saprospiraceae bacterium]|nr:hypothetical protein [Saprospiraceae bacterium]
MYEYKWYKKNDSLKNYHEVDERILVNAVNEDYCVDVKLKVALGTSKLWFAQKHFVIPSGKLMHKL